MALKRTQKMFYGKDNQRLERRAAYVSSMARLAPLKSDREELEKQAQELRMRSEILLAQKTMAWFDRHC